MKQVIVTTSWDDGDPLDLRLAQLLKKHGTQGTFYVPITGYLGRETITSSDLQDLCREGFEIGGHSYSHRSLRGLQTSDLQHEIAYSRDILEQRCQRTTKMFCYPNGHYDQTTLSFVRDSGFLGARTTRMLRTDAGDNPFEMPTTLQAFPHPPATYIKNALKGRNISSLVRQFLNIAYSGDWVQFGKSTFDEVLRHGGVWHLYGHSWELQEFHLWNELECLLEYISGRKGVHYLTNGQLAQTAFPQPEAQAQPAA